MADLTMPNGHKNGPSIEHLKPINDRALSRNAGVVSLEWIGPGRSDTQPAPHASTFL